MRPPRAILFDLDDTLLDTTASATRVWRQTAEAFAPAIGHTPEHIDNTLARSRQWFWADPQRNRQARTSDLYQARREVALMGLRELGMDDRQLADRFADHYTELRIDSMRLFPGVVETLRHLRGRGVRLALISNGHAESQRRKVTSFNLEPFFDAVLIEGELGYGKPNPRVYQRALEACGSAPARDAWCVGDNLEWEIEAPGRLGMGTVWVDWEGVGLPPDANAKPDRIVRRTSELMDYA